MTKITIDGATFDVDKVREALAKADAKKTLRVPKAGCEADLMTAIGAQ